MASDQEDFGGPGITNPMWMMNRIILAAPDKFLRMAALQLLADVVSLNEVASVTVTDLLDKFVQIAASGEYHPPFSENETLTEDDFNKLLNGEDKEDEDD